MGLHGGLSRIALTIGVTDVNGGAFSAGAEGTCASRFWLYVSNVEPHVPSQPSGSVRRGVIFPRELGDLLFELAQLPVLGKQLLGLQRHPALLLLKFVE